MVQGPMILKLLHVELMLDEKVVSSIGVSALRMVNPVGARFIHGTTKIKRPTYIKAWKAYLKKAKLIIKSIDLAQKNND